MKTLTLALKKPWFDKIKSGEKKEEYRECSDYWINRFSKLCGKFVMIYAGSHPYCICERRVMVSCADLKCDRLVFTLGYPKADDKERRLVFKNPKIRIGQGRPEWGAERGKNYFVITWEE
jgi:hypothetical protein